MPDVSRHIEGSTGTPPRPTHPTAILLHNGLSRKIAVNSRPILWFPPTGSTALVAAPLPDIQPALVYGIERAADQIGGAKKFVIDKFIIL
jgi:hypothetical protein